ncbi:3-ketoacyl-CoA thiolase, mitochondrial isoform X2 [Daktulosphaira vitifoliae]|uniref:3-ketoacyl-CoA thiolase, mitochondrial isoform X2 n=1 Tax=Daktulosphaira vitifoliae TaxID=58002 RepID=UPI0021AA4229|nr:3-ketoacyl-CoA thiolase, mitochondrial isoform X2 [Daktulosphaira vitifoliae]
MSLTKGIFIVAAKRTPFGTYGGKFVKTSSTQLQVTAAKAALAAGNIDPNIVDSVIIGNVLMNTSSDGAFLPRHVLLHCGIPQDRHALGINRLCGSGFQSIVNGAQSILTGESNVVLTGGVDNMSQAPHVVRDARFGIPLGAAYQFEDSLWTGLTDTFCKLPMALTAEKLAEVYKVTRQEVDEFALRSQTLWKEAQAKNVFSSELAPVTIKVKKTDVTVDIDEHPKPKTTLETLAKLPTVFKKDGVVTAGSASINEAFGAQTLACQKELKLNIEKLNVNGGAIAIGHPLAASGARITTHLVHELRRKNLNYAIGSACIGGGQGIAVLIEKV